MEETKRPGSPEHQQNVISVLRDTTSIQRNSEGTDLVRHSVSDEEGTPGSDREEEPQGEGENAGLDASNSDSGAAADDYMDPWSQKAFSAGRAATAEEQLAAQNPGTDFLGLGTHGNDNSSSSDGKKGPPAKVEVLGMVHLDPELAERSPPRDLADISVKDAGLPHPARHDEEMEPLQVPHDLQGMFHCTTCSKACTTQAKLNKHNKEVHNDESFPCSTCPKIYKTKSNRTKHEKPAPHRRHESQVHQTRSPPPHHTGPWTTQ